jgi:hypothetical protein
MPKSIRAIIAAGAIIAAAVATLGAADAGYDAYGYGPYSPCPPYLLYPPFPYGIAEYGAPTYYYGGFYGPRVVLAPRPYRTRYGYVVRYRNIPRY